MRCQHFTDRRDPVSMVMLRFLLQNLDRGRLLLVETYRGDEVDPPMMEALQDMSRHPTADPISLDGLDIESLRVYAEALSGRETSREMAATLHTATHGNPFFVNARARCRTVGDRPGSELLEPSLIVEAGQGSFPRPSS